MKRRGKKNDPQEPPNQIGTAKGTGRYRQVGAKLWLISSLGGITCLVASIVGAIASALGANIVEKVALGIAIPSFVAWIPLSAFLALSKYSSSLKVEVPLSGEGDAPLTEARRWELLQLESELLQSRFDKYDSLVFQVRGWMVTIAIAVVSAFIALENHPRSIPLLGVLAGAAFWALEYRWRLDWYKYVQRYKTIRQVLHENLPLAAISPLDLTDSYRRRKQKAAYVKEYGPWLGPSIQRAYQGREADLPPSILREMGLFYLAIVGGLWALPWLMERAM